MSTRSEEDRANGRRMLERWLDRLDDEPEVGTRLMLLLLYGRFHLRDKQPGWDLELEIERRLGDRSKYDPAAEDALYTLDRCAGGLHRPDAALGRVRRAAEHFGPGAGQSVLRRPVEYYRCSVNLAAKLIENGEHEEAVDVSARVSALIDEYRPGTFARLDFAYGNETLAQYRTGRLSATAAAERQWFIATEHAPADDPFYALNALAVYRALEGRLDVASEIFERLRSDLYVDRAEPEPSMVYLIEANACIVRFLAGSDPDCAATWSGLHRVANASNYTDRTIIVNRHEMLSELFENDVGFPPHEFDRYLLEHHPHRFGPLWRNFGHGFTMPALELWREN